MFNDKDIEVEKTNIIEKAKKKTLKKKAFFLSLVFFMVFSAFFLFLDKNVGWHRITWAFYPIFAMGVIVLFQGIFAFDFFGLANRWEKEEIRKEVEKRRKVLEAFEEEYGDIEELELEDLREIRKAHQDTDFV